MKSILAVGAVVALAGTVNAQGLIISEIVDGTAPGGLPKFVELTNTSNAPINMSGFHLMNFNNGASDAGFGSYALSGSLAAGDSIVFSYENGDSPGVGTFFEVYGFDPDNFDQGSFINGDDTLAILNAEYVGGSGPVNPATIHDVYGVIGTDGSGEAWEYMDSYAFRNFNSISPNGGTFNLSDWTFGGANALDGDASPWPLHNNNTTPGTHSFIPTPGAASLLGFAGLAAARRRRSA